MSRTHTLLNMGPSLMTGDPGVEGIPKWEAEDLTDNDNRNGRSTGAHTTPNRRGTKGHTQGATGMALPQVATLERENALKRGSGRDGGSGD